MMWLLLQIPALSTVNEVLADSRGQLVPCERLELVVHGLSQDTPAVRNAVLADLHLQLRTNQAPTCSPLHPWGPLTAVAGCLGADTRE